jgi:hypothetical protein
MQQRRETDAESEHAQLTPDAELGRQPRGTPAAAVTTERATIATTSHVVAQAADAAHHHPDQRRLRRHG